jgi:hypothetical protein
MEPETKISVQCSAVNAAVEQNNGNTTDTIHISLVIWCWATFCLQYSRSPWNVLVQVLNSF